MNKKLEKSIRAFKLLAGYGTITYLKYAFIEDEDEEEHEYEYEVMQALLVLVVVLVLVLVI